MARVAVGDDVAAKVRAALTFPHSRRGWWGWRLGITLRCGSGAMGELRCGSWRTRLEIWFGRLNGWTCDGAVGQA